MAVIRRFDLDADSKLSKEEFLAGIKSQEPFSKMIVREKMARREERLAAAAKTQLESRNPSTKRSTKTKALPLAEENWNNQQTLNTRALDRSFKSAMSRSPLKHRVDFGDLEGTTP